MSEPTSRRDGWALSACRASPGRPIGAGQASDSGLYTPKWISTTYTMLLLRDFGLPAKNPQARKACRLLLEGGLQPDGGINYGAWAKMTRRAETCVTGMVLSVLSYFEYDDDRLDTIAGHLLEQQMPDGGWNCRRPGGATHASVHTTISVLEGLRLYELRRGGKLKAVCAAQLRGREFLLLHRLFRSDRTGEIIKPVFLRFAFPPRWHYDILRAFDYFQAAGAATSGFPTQSRSSSAASSRTDLAAPEHLPGEDILRARAARCAKPLEHAPRASRAQVVAEIARYAGNNDPSSRPGNCRDDQASAVGASASGRLTPPEVGPKISRSSTRRSKLVAPRRSAA